MNISGKLFAFQISENDNVATMLSNVKSAGDVIIHGEACLPSIKVQEPITAGHKIAVKNINKGQSIIKYNTVIGKATRNILKGSWVHLHNIESNYDERSSKLDFVSGVPKDTLYE